MHNAGGKALLLGLGSFMLAQPVYAEQGDALDTAVSTAVSTDALDRAVSTVIEGVQVCTCLAGGASGC